ncbi:metallophosphoesterase family protein, partial [uncultured Winogradskyella sp.]|uniref:metallophosphoesterase family protein n=1 Tax=uncultured Winogradskyella sp. TaxID=395353 RepID=UPI0030ED74F2
MKKILLLSDTHSYIDDAILKHVKQVDEVWHAGDIGNLAVTDSIKKLKPLKAVYGNIDDAKARTEFPLNNRFMCEDVDVWITHIGGSPPKYNNKVKA